MNSAPAAHLLRYDRPAARWTEALPLGNGRLGAMVFGGLAEERLALNEATLWSGRPVEWNNPTARDVLPQVRAAVFAGRHAEAVALCKKMQGPYTQSYLPLGDLRLRFPDAPAAPPADYRRELDLDAGLVSIGHTRDGARHTREIFASHPDQLIVVRLSADRPGRVSFTLSADSQLQHALRVEPAPGGACDLVLAGRAPGHAAPVYFDDPDPVRYPDEPALQGMAFELRVRVRAEGGRVVAASDSVAVSGADAVTLLVSAATGFNGPDRAPGIDGLDPSPLALRPLDAASALDHPALLARHQADHRALYRRASLDLGGAPALAELSTDARILRHADGAPDPALAALLFHYGRYLLIACSRPGGQPANLQGIWNDQLRPPWSSNLTININTQMNYWPAEPANLAECHEPLFDLVADLARHGRETARINYGARGWVSHHNADLWRQTAPVGHFGQGDPMWANWCLSGPWLCRHLWEHHAHAPDPVFLRERAWPIIKGAAEFLLDWLVEGPDGHLVTAPSTSPENAFFSPDGTEGTVTWGSTSDLQIARDLFTCCIRAARELGIEPDLTARLDAARARLLPPRVGSRGQLQEWAEDLLETDVHHRHASHLYGLHPGDEITPADPRLFAAARRVLELRGDDGTGWSLAWKICFWARLLDGDRAHRFIVRLLQPAFDNLEISLQGGGVYPNLFDAHPPFQIDGNLGYVAGVCEMLLQSHAGELRLLPALPSAWPAGAVRGLRARGGFEFAEIVWREGRLVRAALHAPRGGSCVLRLGELRASVTLIPGETRVFDSSLQPTTP